MKKLLSILICALVIVFCVSCQSAESSDGNVSQLSGNETESQPLEIYVPSNGGELPTLALSSFKEYETYMSENSLPDHFIFWKQLSLLGSFKSMVFLEHRDHLEYNEYFYNFKGANGTPLTLLVEHRIEENDNSMQAVNIIMESQTNTDLRRLKDTATGLYVNDGIEYHYIDGKLFSFEWSSNGVHFVLGTSGNVAFLEYPSSHAIINNFLTKGSAQAAIASIDAHILENKTTVAE